MIFWVSFVIFLSLKRQNLADTIDCVQQMLDDLKFSVKFDEKDKVANPAAGDLFEIGNGEYLAENFKKEFHTFAAKGLFLCGRARPDIKQVVSVLCSRVKSPNQDDWDKLVRLMGFCTQQSWTS